MLVRRSDSAEHRCGTRQPIAYNGNTQAARLRFVLNGKDMVHFLQQSSRASLARHLQSPASLKHDLGARGYGDLDPASCAMTDVPSQARASIIFVIHQG